MHCHNEKCRDLRLSYILALAGLLLIHATGILPGSIPAALAQQNTWIATGSMATARQAATATLLPNGKVLIAGGESPLPAGVTNTAELYDPATGRFTATGSMNYPRRSHTATLLPNGKVLITGGGSIVGGSSIVLSSAELYDPVNGTFTQIGSMSSPREYHTATLLPYGLVLIVGGISDRYTVLDTAELYDPSEGALGSFTWTASLNQARLVHTATLLPNGTVLIAGGHTLVEGQSSYLASAELYHLVEGVPSFDYTSNDLSYRRDTHTATLLPNGKVLIAGGRNGITEDGYTIPIGSAELYDTTTRTFGPTTGALQTARSGAWATLLPDGEVLIAGGVSVAGTTKSAELYDSGSGTFSYTGSMVDYHWDYEAVLLPNGIVLAAGGVGSSSAELYASLVVVHTTPQQPVAPGTSTTFTDETTGVSEKVILPFDVNMGGTVYKAVSFIYLPPLVFSSTRLPGTPQYPNWSEGNTPIPLGTTCTVIAGTGGNCVVIRDLCFDSNREPVVPCDISANSTPIQLVASYKTQSSSACPAYIIADDDQMNWADITTSFDPTDPTIGGGTKKLNTDTAIVDLGVSSPYAVVTVTGVTDGATYTLGAVPTAGCDTSDSIGPVYQAATLTLTGGVPPGVGLFTATCSGARDHNHMLAAPVSVTYTVQYAQSGQCLGGPGHQILQPINADGSSVFKLGSTVPAKFRVCDANGASIGTPGVVKSVSGVRKSATVLQNIDEAVDTTPASSGFRFDTTGQQWIWNISTKPLSKGIWDYTITLNDGSAIYFKFGLR